MKYVKTKYRVGIVPRAIPTFVFMLFSILSLKATGEEYRIPDFAFPQTVESESRSGLKKALQSKDDLQALRNAMNLCLATTMLKDKEGLVSNLELLDSVAGEVRGVYKGLLDLIEAEILWQQYSMNSGVYDSRSMPVDSLYPADPQEWNGEMFKSRILQLVDLATSPISLYPALNIDEISVLLTEDGEAQKMGMTVSQFIAFKGVEILKNFARVGDSSVIPFYPDQMKKSIEGMAGDKVRQLLDIVIKDISGSNSVVKALAMNEYSNFCEDAAKETYLKDRLNEMKGKAGEGILLYSLWRSYPDNSKYLYPEIKRWLSEYPEGIGAANLAYAEREISSKKIEIEFPRSVLPGKAFEGKVTVSNLDKGYLLIYKLAGGQYTVYDELILKKFNGNAKPVRIIEVKEEGIIPFKYERDIRIEGLEEGLYVVIPSKERRLPEGWNKATSYANYSTLRVTDIAILTTNETTSPNTGRVYVVKGENQQPIEGAEVSYYSGSSTRPGGKLITNREGWVSVPDGYYRIEAIAGKSKTITEAGFNYYSERISETRHVSILTDLAVYRPGDTIQFAIVGWLQEKNGNKLLKDTEVEVKLFDANYQECEKTNLRLDKDGRASGSLIVPQGRLLGNYNLTAGFPDGRNGGGSINFLVEEYKQPPFMVTLEQVPSSDSSLLNFKGLATTYSGMPVGDASVDIKVEYLPWRWGMPIHSNASFYVELKCDEKGEFNLQLPVGSLKGTPFEKGRFSVVATATSKSGESISSQPLYFYLGNEFDIRPGIPDKIKVDGDSVRFYVPVYDMAGLPVIKTLNYRITDIFDTDNVLTGAFESPYLELDDAIIKNGRYRFEFSEENSGISVNTECVVWRESDTQAPYPTELWIPETQYLYRQGEKSVEIKFGSFWEEWILCTLSDGEKVISTEWLSPDSILLSTCIDIPDSLSTYFVTLAGMHDLNGVSGQIKIIPQRNLEKMEIETLSFRDHISAGDEEEWKFKVLVGDKVTSDVNLFAVLTDKALNAIKEFKWNLNIWENIIYCKYRLITRTPYRAYSYKTFDPATMPKIRWTDSQAIPAWQTYGYPFVSYPYYRGVGPVKYAARAMKNMQMEYATDDAVMETAVEQSLATAGGADTDTTPQEVELRPVEMPLAFFKTDLKTDAEGLVAIDFKVPDYNTTWQLQIAGYNSQLKNATLVLDAVASKPVMIKTNLPQYLRTGDFAEFSATIFNNSERDIRAEGKFEIVDASTGEIIKVEKYDFSQITPSGSRVVTVSFEVPDNSSGVIVRSYALSGNHTDGEQGLVPVLPSSTPVVESTTFYAGMNTSEINMKLPKMKPEANITLKYCDNPAWEVLLSLPALTENTSGGSLSIANRLYGILLSRQIIGSNHDISQGLQKILESEDSTLSMSALEKDENLKITALQATPWVNNAKSDTQRIRNLSCYLDTIAIDMKIKALLGQLTKMQNPDGGFVWFDGMKSSPYITSRIISLLGYLNDKGILPEDLKRVARKAVGYYDIKLISYFEKNKKINLFENLDYFYSRKMLGYETKGTLKKIEKTTLDSIVKEWRHWDAGMKCKSASLLLSDSGFRNEGQVIVESLKQFVGTRLPLNQEALLLDLFNKNSVGSDITDRVMEAMLLQKETEDWSDDNNVAGVVYSLMGLLKNEVVGRNLPEIYINGKKLELSSTQSLAGSFTITLDPKTVSGAYLSINRDSGLPAWGGIFSQYILPIKEVKPSKVENLSVEKRIFKVESDGSVSEAKKFKKGDKVRVVISITIGKDMDYVVVSDSRASALQPDSQVSGSVIIDGLFGYKENRADKTSFFIERMPYGKYIISYDCHVEREGEYALGITEVQSLYAPAQVSHSAGSVLKVE